MTRKLTSFSCLLFLSLTMNQKSNGVIRDNDPSQGPNSLHLLKDQVIMLEKALNEFQPRVQQQVPEQHYSPCAITT